MLPTDRPLEPREIEQVARDFDRWIKQRRFTLESIAKKLGQGYSTSVLSQFRSGRYKGDLEKVARATNELMERDERSRELPKPKDYVETEVARRILTVVRTAIEAGGIGVFYGPSGTGKTKSLEAAHTMFTGSVLIRVLQSTRRGPGLINAIGRALGLTKRRSLDIMQDMVIETLRGSGRPILIDEAQALDPSGILVLRDIHDAAGVPIVLAGTIDVRKKIDDSQLWYGQMASRVIATCDITEYALRPKNPRPLFTVDEIMQIFSGDQLRLTDDGADYLTMLACVPGAGGLRVVKQIMLIASRLASLRDKPLDAKTLRKITKQMQGAAYNELLANRAEQLMLRQVG